MLNSGGNTPTMQEMLRYWYTKLSIEEIAKRLEISVNKVHRLRRRYRLPTRSAIEKTGRANHEPTPEEIVESAAFIRSNWTPAQEASRRVNRGAIEPWTPPSYSYNSRSGIFSSTSLSNTGKDKDNV
jgi:hypothetical protein